jgi:uncharacterized protein
VTGFILLPGIYDSGPIHWQTRWERAEPDRFVRFAPSDWDRPQRLDWIDALARAVAAAPDPPVLVAHSLSCLLVPIWATQSAAPVAGAVLVAPVDPGSAAFPAAAHEFREVPRFRLPFPTLVVGSQDDPYASATWSRDLATDLGARFVDAGLLGHINADSGLGEWRWGRDLVAGFCAGLNRP